MSDEIWEEKYDEQDKQHNNEPLWRSKNFDDTIKIKL